jgi:hypothetical protein
MFFLNCLKKAKKINEHIVELHELGIYPIIFTDLKMKVELKTVQVYTFQYQNQTAIAICMETYL